MTDKLGKFHKGVIAGVGVFTALVVFTAPASAAKLSYGIAPQTSLSAGDLQQMKAAGVDFIRLPFDWGTVQAAAGDCTPQGGACNWTALDAAVGAASAAGINVLPNINQSAPFVNSDIFKPPTNDIAAWEDFIQAAVQRYGKGGVLPKPIKSWQVWNEPSSSGDFSPKPNVKKYGKILKAAGNTIHKTDKKAEVLVGGLFPDTGPKGIPLEKFLKGLYKIKKIEKSFDTVSVHPYSPDPGKGVLNQMKRARKVMDKAGDKKGNLAATELGYTSGCPTCKKGNTPPVVKKNEKAQAKALTESFKTLKKNAKKLGLNSIIWFTWQDTPDATGGCTFCHTSGLIDVNGAQKPAYKAYKKAAG